MPQSFSEQYATMPTRELQDAAAEGEGAYTPAAWAAIQDACRARGLNPDGSVSGPLALTLTTTGVRVDTTADLAVDDVPLQPPARDRRGAQQLAAVIIVWLGVAALALLVQMWKAPQTAGVTTVVRTGLTFWLGAMLAQRRNWARGVAGFLSIVGGLMMLPLVPDSIAFGSWGPLWVGGSAIASLVIGGMLLLSRPIRAEFGAL